LIDGESIFCLIDQDLLLGRQGWVGVDYAAAAVVVVVDGVEDLRREVLVLAVVVVAAVTVIVAAVTVVVVAAVTAVSVVVDDDGRRLGLADEDPRIDAFAARRCRTSLKQNKIRFLGSSPTTYGMLKYILRFDGNILFSETKNVKKFFIKNAEFV
jgi:hypothetical protein